MKFIPNTYPPSYNQTPSYLGIDFGREAHIHFDTCVSKCNITHGLESIPSFSFLFQVSKRVINN